MKTNILVLVLLSASCIVGGIAQAASLGPAALVAGAARLDNGSIITLGQPFAGAMSGGGVSLSVGLTPTIGAATNGPTQPVLTLVTNLAGGVFRFTISTQPGRTYAIHSSTNLAPGSWVELQTLIGTGGPLPFTDTGAVNYPQRFYRVQAR